MNLGLRALSRREVRELDVRAAVELGLSTLVLMENAGRGAAGWLAELATMASPNAPKPRILILAGPGNNGGDGAVIARHLDAWRFPVCIVWFAENGQLRGDAATQASILERSGVPQLFHTGGDDGQFPIAAGGETVQLADWDWLVDGLFGTGLSRPVEEPLRSVISSMNDSGKSVFALDVPSGLDADSGRPLGIAVRARATATFVAPKLGFANAGDYTGEVAVIDIGVPRWLLKHYEV